MTLEEYHRLIPLPHASGIIYVKPGARGYPDPVYDLLARRVEPFGERALDLNPGVGWASLPLEGEMDVDRIETSKAALLALEKSGFKARRALPWEVQEGSYDLVLLVLPANRGSWYTQLSLLGAARALKPGGRLYIAGDKHKGFERYFKEAKALLGFGVVLQREGPVRVALLEKEKEPPPLPEVWTSFQEEIHGHAFRFHHLPGVFSAGRLDPASRLLLGAIEEVRNLDVLDLGAGYGGLTLPLAHRGGRVSAAEDDWVSVLSLERSLEANGLVAQVFHSDVDEALPRENRYDIVVANPPFHVGGRVILDVAQAFVQAAYARLRSGGRFYLVSNPFLPYEALLEDVFGNWKMLRLDGYKVLLAQRR
ncbi:MAG: methyltransferase [Thermaceae bacterium]